MRAITAVTLAALLTSLSGCSWLFVDRAPTDIEKGEQVACTESRTAPIVDVVLGAVMIFTAIGIFANVNESEANVAAGGYVVIGALFAVSAASGFLWTDRCRRLHDEYEESYVPEPLPGRPAKPAPPPRTGRKGDGCRADGSCEPDLGCHQGRCLDLIK